MFIYSAHNVNNPTIWFSFRLLFILCNTREHSIISLNLIVVHICSAKYDDISSPMSKHSYMRIVSHLRRSRKSLQTAGRFQFRNQLVICLRRDNTFIPSVHHLACLAVEFSRESRFSRARGKHHLFALSKTTYRETLRDLNADVRWVIHQFARTAASASVNPRELCESGDIHYSNDIWSYVYINCTIQCGNVKKNRKFKQKIIFHENGNKMEMSVRYVFRMNGMCLIVLGIIWLNAALVCVEGNYETIQNCMTFPPPWKCVFVCLLKMRLRGCLSPSPSPSPCRAKHSELERN